jgi:uncharacterized protein (TIGR00251 family)
VSLPLREAADGVILQVRVTPKSSRNEVAGLRAGEDGRMSVQVKVTAPPDKGKANEAVIACLAVWLKLRRSDMAMVAGAAGRNKSVHIAGEPRKLRALIAEAVARTETRER